MTHHCFPGNPMFYKLSLDSSSPTTFLVFSDLQKNTVTYIFSSHFTCGSFCLEQLSSITKFPCSHLLPFASFHLLFFRTQQVVSTSVKPTMNYPSLKRHFSVALLCTLKESEYHPLLHLPQFIEITPFTYFPVLPTISQIICLFGVRSILSLLSLLRRGTTFPRFPYHLAF